jgi:hypothetical protein
MHKYTYFSQPKPTLRQIGKQLLLYQSFQLFHRSFNPVTDILNIWSLPSKTSICPGFPHSTHLRGIQPPPPLIPNSPIASYWDFPIRTPSCRLLPLSNLVSQEETSINSVYTHVRYKGIKHNSSHKHLGDTYLH